MIIIYIQMGGSKKMQQVRSIANRPSGGGNKKQGLAPTGGRPGWLSNFIRTNAGGYFRGIPGPVDPCPTKEVGAQTVADQAQANLLRGVTKINGNLYISGNVTDWTPFDCLKEITGGFTINNNNALETISGFGRLTSTNDFFINNNSNLTEITGFGSLTSTKNTFSIHTNEKLETIPTFGSLTSIGNDFVIYANTALETISGFGSLTTIMDSFAIFNNDNLTDASGLWKVVSVGGIFYCYENTKFTNTAFAALVTSLKTIGGNIGVTTNSGTNWALPAVWKDGTKLNWGVNTTDRKLNGATDASNLGNFSTTAGGELFDLPDKNGN
jgi:hypothetical protein